MLVLNEGHVKQLLDSDELIRALEQAFKRDLRNVVMPSRLQMVVAAGVQLLMPCYDPAIPAGGFKGVFVAKNPAKSEHRVQATYFLLEPTTGKILAVIEANHMTDVRTACVSAIATRHMARTTEGVLAVFGTGRQALAHVQIFASAFQLKTILVCGSSADRGTEFAKKLTKTVPVPVRAADPRTCAGEADVICTCTSATTPLFDGLTLKSGSHLNVVGAFRPTDREVDSETVRRSRVVVDTYDGALSEAGDLIIPLREEAVSRGHIVADLHEMVSEKVCGRTCEEEITLFKSVGCALEDLVAASLVYDAAMARASQKRKANTT